jgi:redox-sensing transcriptional repressor
VDLLVHVCFLLATEGQVTAVTVLDDPPTYTRIVNIDISLSNKPVPRRDGPSAIPQASLLRLPQYHHYLMELDAQGIGSVSCTTIGLALDCIPVQIRKDLQYTGIIGKPKTGYSVPKLIKAIETFLGWNKVNKAFLVGAGNLGTAILGHERFSRYGLRIVAAFDTNPAKIGLIIHGREVFSLKELAALTKRKKIHLGIITTPAEVAHTIADEMVKAGILAIWNFAPIRLKVPSAIFVHNEDLYSSLASLSCKLAARL